MTFKKTIFALLTVAFLLPASFATAAEGQSKKKSKNKTEQRAKKEQFSLRIFCANMTAAAVAGLAGGTFRALWWEVDRNNEYFWSKLLASGVLLTAPHAFAEKIGASSNLADLALISGAVLAH